MTPILLQSSLEFYRMTSETSSAVACSPFCADVAGVVADFMTIPSAYHLAQVWPLRQDYIDDRITELDNKPPEERKMECWAMIDAEFELAFPHLIPRLPCSFTWSSFLSTCDTKDNLDLIRLVVANYQHIPDVHRWTRQWFDNLTTEQPARTGGFHEQVWHLISHSLLRSSKNPVKKWENWFVRLLHSSCDSSWVDWFVALAIEGRVPGLSPNYVDNAVFARVLDRTFICSTRTLHILSFFTKPVSREHYGAFLSRAIVSGNLALCRTLVVKLGAELSAEDWAFLKRCDAGDGTTMASGAVRTKDVCTFFRYIQAHGLPKAAAAFQADMAAEDAAAEARMRVRKSAVDAEFERKSKERSDQYDKDVAKLHQQCTHDLRLLKFKRDCKFEMIDQEERARKRRAIALCRELSVPDP